MLDSSATLGLRSVEQYEPLIGSEATDRILRKAERLRALHVVHVSSTFYGGGVTEMLTPLTLMMNAVGIQTGWRMIQGTPAFFSCTKKLHNALQGDDIQLTNDEKAIYEQVTFENAIRLDVEDADAVIVHDPQPLPLISTVQERKLRGFGSAISTFPCLTEPCGTICGILSSVMTRQSCICGNMLRRWT